MGMVATHQVASKVRAKVLQHQACIAPTSPVNGTIAAVFQPYDQRVHPRLRQPVDI